MFCPKCGHDETQVANSRKTSRRNQVWRRRKCLKCETVFTTREGVDLESVVLVEKRDDSYEPFNRAKLLISLAKALDHLPEAAETAYELMQTIESQLYAKIKGGQITSETIAKLANTALQRFDKAAAVKYESYISVS